MKYILGLITVFFISTDLSAQPVEVRIPAD